MDLSPDRKIAGVLIPTFAIRGMGDLGIGDTWSVMEFINWAADHGFGLVKFLPINETGGDHSPYNAISARALDPTTIRTSAEALPDLREQEYAEAVGAEAGLLDSVSVNYSLVKPLKRRLLEEAFARFNRNHFQRKSARARQFSAFLDRQSDWIHDYVLFRALLEENRENEQWRAWPEPHRTPAAARAWAASLSARKGRLFAARMRFFSYVQWQAFSQWRKVKAHAEQRGVALMGDIPFGVSPNSAEVWGRPELFRTGWCGGTPPDKIFKHDPFVQKWGQNWGIPLYNWAAMRGDDFRWWRSRVRGVREFFHLFRIDHVLGFYRIHGFPWLPEENATFLPLNEEQAREHTGGPLPGFQPRPDDTLENRELNRKEGEEYLRIILQEAGTGRVIGEDLGEVPDYVRPSLTSLGIAGYKIPQWEKLPDGSLISGRDYERLSLATYGTHDHEPLRAQWEHLVEAADRDPEAKRELRALCGFAEIEGDPPRTFTQAVHLALLTALFESNSWIAVVMITDVFARTERFNFPGVASSANWTQRMHATLPEIASDPTAQRVHELIVRTGRNIQASPSQKKIVSLGR